MRRIRNFINKLSKSQKVICLILLLGFVLLLTIGIPTLAIFRNKSAITTTSVWDGSVASSYRKGTGTVENPYIISNGSELAYFYTQLSSNDYENTYFALSNDIVLNNGIFSYDTGNGIEYILNSQTYYVDEYSNKYYDNADRTGTEIGTVNIFNSLDGFKGSFDGNSFTIYGLYIPDENNDNIALFTDLKGNIHDLYVENSIVYGGTVTAGIASTTNNASLSNVLYGGYVIGKNTLSVKTINSIPTIPVINLQSTEKTDSMDLTNNIPFIGSEIISTTITGNYIISGATEEQTSIKINGTTVTNGSFEIDLGNTVLNSIPVLTSTTYLEPSTLTFSNLSYNIVYKYGVSGGIVANCNNTTIENTINKAYVYGYSTAGGLVGVTTSSISINQSYNVGNINGHYVSGGLIGTIEKSSNNITISKDYNTGDMSAINIGGMIGIINNNSGSISINNTFNTSTTNYSIGTVQNTSVNVTNAYFANGTIAVKSGAINGSIALTTMDNLKTKSYDVSNLSFNEFVGSTDLETNSQNVWVYKDNLLPVLFIDSIINPIANINVGIHSWNNLRYELNTVKFGSNITFSIEESDSLKPLKEIYYYISNSSEPLTEHQISQINSWIAYSDVVQISTEGPYIIYVKAVDYSDNITYINTDSLILDLTGPIASISVDNNTWSNLRDNLNYIYIDRQKNLTVDASDTLSDVSSIKYYDTNVVLNTSELNALNESVWSTYTDGILVSENGKHIIYVKVTDSCNNVTYINSDYIVINGYTETNLIIGRNPNSYLNADPYITNRSTITLNINYSESSATNFTDYTHNIMSNILLPLGTKMTLIDNITDKVYEYKITTAEDIYNYNNSCNPFDLDCVKVATYPLTLFKQTGMGTTNAFYSESSYYNEGTISENFVLILDLSNTNISTNYNNVNLFMELHNSSGTNVRPTLYSTVKAFNIYSNVSSESTNASLYLTTSYSGNAIEFNSNSSTDISITSRLNYKYLDTYKIVDTTYEDKEIGLSVKLVDSNGNIVSKDHMKNIIFKVGSSIYYPEEDNIIRISLENGIADITKSLTIITYENNGNLEPGTYSFKISNYAAYDGYYDSEIGSTEISIPVNVSDNITNVTHSFNVIMNESNRIINKSINNVNVPFSILQNGSLSNPNIRISLYKKDQLTGYNQGYSIVDLSNYVSNTLNRYEGNIYYVSTNPVQYDEITKSYNSFELDLITANFENTGYKFVFDLYDGTKKIGTIEKHFIVK